MRQSDILVEVSNDKHTLSALVEQVFASEAGGPCEQDMLRCQVHSVSPLLHVAA